MPLPILIIGAGLSGLTTARLLTNANIPVIVFEATTPSRTQGYAISLRDWGFTTLLDSLGSLPLSSLTKNVAPDRHIGGTGWIDLALLNNHTGELIVKPPPEPNPSILRANRNALRAWIADRGEEDLDIRYNHKLTSLSGTLGNLTAHFANGALYTGALLIAADGVHSTPRSLLLPSIIPDILPVLMYHGDLELSRSDFDTLIRPHAGDSNILAGVGDGFNTPLTICNITPTHVHLDWSYSRPSTGSSDPLFNPKITSEEAKVLPSALLEEIASRELAEPWSHFLNETAMKSHRVFNWLSRCVFVERGDVDLCMEKGVVFVGDSWHAMPIFGGEGGNHALVDGVELAGALLEEIEGGGGWADEGLARAIGVYYDGAWRRCQDAVRRSRQRFYQLHRPMSEWVEIKQKAEKRAQQQQ
ncbi:FAD-dependent monooxygenase [Aspergillus cavernicola]|uniref:FAD-dependent monooxygenase n=1 Tax=Aspergillus cavernicola TaxID=176166 RepID=A0ABR4J2N1_9EURO